MYTMLFNIPIIKPLQSYRWLEEILRHCLISTAECGHGQQLTPFPPFHAIAIPSSPSNSLFIPSHSLPMLHMSFSVQFFSIYTFLKIPQTFFWKSSKQCGESETRIQKRANIPSHIFIKMVQNNKMHHYYISLIRYQFNYVNKKYNWS